MGDDHSSPEVDNQGQKSRSRVMVRVQVRVSKNGHAVGLTMILNRGHFYDSVIVSALANTVCINYCTNSSNSQKPPKCTQMMAE